ncbi:chitin synthase [Zychaea mexicana]|uniref:chitin synthase n=1 Tax=Zychaea mexicana TaxID=64656 RepID=UPI0022FEB51A|nr:chitin synthase [Zychaea mexicana]KAI9497320.1 chitin synthase [Zychaea mexicana]
MQQQSQPYRRVSVSRARSLSRPERQRPRQGMLNRTPSQHRAAADTPMPNQGRPTDPEEDEIKPKVLVSWWSWIAFLVTCCFPNCCIKVVFRKPNALMQQAWREKMALCYIILLLMGALAYITYGLNQTLCPDSVQNPPFSSVLDGVRTPMYYDNPRVFGEFYRMEDLQSFFSSKGLELNNDYQNMEIGSIFDGDTAGVCSGFDQGSASTVGNCRLDSPYGGSISTSDGSCLSLRELQAFASSTGTIGFEWADLRPGGVDTLGQTDLVVLGDIVLNITKYIDENTQFFGEDIDTALRATRGNDGSLAVMYSGGKTTRDCLLARYTVGNMETESGGCIANTIVMNMMLAVIVTIIAVRYSMALLFQWVISKRLVKPGGRSNWLAWRSIKGGNDDPANHIPGPYNNYGPMNAARGSSASVSSGASSSRGPQSEQSSAFNLGNNPTDIVSTELYSVMLVTCYSEGEDGLRTTMDSLAETTYSKKHKCFFVIADGMITGAGETKSTPDIVVSMMDLDPAMANPKAASYLAIADGEKQLNMAKVYAGHYKGVPCVTIVKCGTEEEQQGAKAGNRGKRDSQLILMSFFQRVLFNDRLSELDYEIFWKLTWLMKGVTPDKFELVLMVDADTKVLPDALTYMVAAMANDITIMGLCGETRIANKRSSWVTAIQVFEYYISHHYAKAFESLFGIVTCLPGCFSMFRIKAPKNGAWVPLLANPDIILEYNQNVVNTLHEKNLLLLGEDRFLSTLMLRTFPKRQMMFVPQARCRTIVPDEFKVLLSQRRRWINSTIHNLMELVLVSDLCGIACLSMQFSIFVDLIAALVLPAAIVMTIYLIVTSAISDSPQWQSLALLICILGLPGVLIAITTFKLIYIAWMAIYIIALPIWNFVLPLYSFWHFDDFSWGATRMVEGEKKDKGHGDAEGKFDSSRLLMRKWEDWEADRTGQRITRNRFTLKTPLDPPLAFDGKSTVTPVTPAFGNIFNDRKMFNSSTSLASATPTPTSTPPPHPPTPPSGAQ